MIIFIVVDLPAPFGPRKPRTSPLATRRLRSLTAVKGPKRLVQSLDLDHGVRCRKAGFCLEKSVRARKFSLCKVSSSFLVLTKLIDQSSLTAMVEDTRQRLVMTAMQLISDKGYESTSVAEILRAAGANSGSLYHFFPAKQDLLIEVLRRYRDGIGPMLLEPAWAGIADPIEKVFALLARYRQALAGTDCFYGCPIGSLALEIHEPDPGRPRVDRCELRRLGRRCGTVFHRCGRPAATRFGSPDLPFSRSRRWREA